VGCKNLLVVRMERGGKVIYGEEGAQGYTGSKRGYGESEQVCKAHGAAHRWVDTEQPRAVKQVGQEGDRRGFVVVSG
jgi:hypothetical protein